MKHRLKILYEIFLGYPVCHILNNKFEIINFDDDGVEIRIAVHVVPGNYTFTYDGPKRIRKYCRAFSKENIGKINNKTNYS